MFTDYTLPQQACQHETNLPHPPLAGFKAAVKIPALRRQRGISLFIVLIVLLLVLIVVLGGLAVSNLNESLVGNQSDSQRAYSAAEALINAAQRDIRLNGRYCNAATLGATGTNGSVGITPAPACTLRYPRDGDARKEDYMEMLTTGAMIGAIDKCAPTANTTFRGVCISSSPTSSVFMADQVGSGQMTNSTGATYSNAFIAPFGNTDYGSAATVGGSVGGSGAVSLALGNNSHYWVEIFPYNIMGVAVSGAGNVPIPDGTYPYVFRITARAQGLRNTTVSVLRTYYVPYPVVRP